MLIFLQFSMLIFYQEIAIIVGHTEIVAHGYISVNKASGNPSAQLKMKQKLLLRDQIPIKMDKTTAENRN